MRPEFDITHACSATEGLGRVPSLLAGASLPASSPDGFDQVALHTTGRAVLLVEEEWAKSCRALPHKAWGRKPTRLPPTMGATTGCRRPAFFGGYGAARSSALPGERAEQPTGRGCSSIHACSVAVNRWTRAIGSWVQVAYSVSKLPRP